MSFLLIYPEKVYNVCNGVESFVSSTQHVIHIQRHHDILPRCHEIFNESFSENFHEIFTWANFYITTHNDRSLQ